MNKNIKLAIISVIALSTAFNLTNISYTPNIIEDTSDAYNNIGLNVKNINVGSSETVSVSKTYVQYGIEGAREFVRFATAISGPIKSVKYTRTVEGLGTKEKEVTTVYKGIQSGDSVYYYNGTEAVTTKSEETDNYYWACYTIEFASSTYKASDITAYITVESAIEGEEAITSTPKTASLDTLKDSEEIQYIYTVEQLKEFRNKVNNGNTFADKTVKLMADIDLSNENWTPIGAYKSEFYGTFEGNGYTVSNLTIDNLDVFGAGLFGYTINASIKDVNLHNVNIRADQEIGTIAGSGTNSTFENIHVTGELNLFANYAYAAGIVSGRDVSLKNCSVLPEGTGTIVSNQRGAAGGIVADVLYGNTVENCHVKNVNITSYSSLGAITGILQADTTVSNCSAENITLTKTRVGGFPAIGLVCGNWVSLSAGVDYLTKFTNLTFNNIELNGSSVISEALSICDISTLYGAPYSGDQQEAFKVEINNVTCENIVDNEIRTASRTTQYIVSLSQLEALSEAVNNGDNYSGKTVVLLADIDLKNEAWTPIGNSTTSFNGTFDGNGHKISNLYVNAEGASNLGFFGFTQNGEIKNVVFENANVSGRTNVAVVSGTPYTSKYTNITIQGHIEVNGLSYVGALGGKNCYADITDITVNADESSYIKADSRENGKAYRSYVGGVIGFMAEGNHTIKNVTSNIDVIGSTIDVGGIVGIAHYGNNLINCSSTGNVTITDAPAIDYCYEIGGIAGTWHNETGYSVTLIDCSYTGLLSATYYEDGEAKTFNDFQNDGLVGGSYNASGTGTLYIDGAVYNKDGKVANPITNFAELKENLSKGNDVVLSNDIVMEEVITFKKGSIDGNGFKLIQGENCVNTWGLLSIDNASSLINIKNLTFEGIKGGAAIRTVSADIIIDNCTFTNANHTQMQGLVRLTDGDAIVKNSKFYNNVATMLITFNFDLNASNDVLTVKNCEFINNTCKDTAAVYYVYGSKCVIDNNKFIGNNISSTGNAAPLYLGFKTGVIVTNNIFKDNTASTTSTSTKRVAGAVMVGNDNVIKGNAFINNSVTGGHPSLTGNSVLASVYYADIDLSGNYWGGSAPVEGQDYFVEYPERNKVIINDFLETYLF